MAWLNQRISNGESAGHRSAARDAWPTHHGGYGVIGIPVDSTRVTVAIRQPISALIWTFGYHHRSWDREWSNVLPSESGSKARLNLHRRVDASPCTTALVIHPTTNRPLSRALFLFCWSCWFVHLLFIRLLFLTTEHVGRVYNYYNYWSCKLGLCKRKIST